MICVCLLSGSILQTTCSLISVAYQDHFFGFFSITDQGVAIPNSTLSSELIHATATIENCLHSDGCFIALFGDFCVFKILCFCF